MLVELNVVEQRLKAVLEVLDGATVVDVAANTNLTLGALSGNFTFTKIALNVRQIAQRRGQIGVEGVRSPHRQCPEQRHRLLSRSDGTFVLTEMAEKVRQIM